ncbi:MAG: hypothetical protein PHN31_03740 [Candidatus Gracilibacteria bacterium]|nr:hypothetical protein [Candidatus Gracilibacteria bacterium]
MENFIEVNAIGTTGQEKGQGLCFSVVGEVNQDTHDILEAAHKGLEDRMNNNPILRQSEYVVSNIKIGDKVINVSEGEIN